MENSKVYYSISEVCDLLDLKPYNLRNWEQNIPVLKPKKNKFGHRIYTNSDIKRLKLVKKLLYTEKYSLKGVSDYLIKNFEKESDAVKVLAAKDLWISIKKDIKIIKNLVDKK